MTEVARVEPTFEEVLEALDLIDESDETHVRSAQRHAVNIQSLMSTEDGSRFPIRLRDISHIGMGFFHRGTIDIGKITVKLAVNTYRVAVKWCVRCADEVDMSGGPILHRHARKSKGGDETSSDNSV